MQGALQTSRLLAELGMAHGFSTAAAGDAKEPAVRAHLLAEAGIGAPLGTVRQVHGRTAAWWPGEVEADALLARVGQAAGVFTADCVPILMADPRTRLAAAVHAGWRGTLAEVAAAAVATLLQAGARADSLRAAIGPHIGACCYVVGEDLAQRFQARFGAGAMGDGGAHGPRLDLGSANRALLLGLGLRPEHVERLPGCTHCARTGEGTPTYFSYRREKELAGRQLSFICPG